MGKARRICDDQHYLNVPAASEERFLRQPSPNIHCMDDFQVMYAGISELTPGYAVDRHPARNHLVLYSYAGAGWIKVDGRRRVIKDGEVLIAPRGTTYSYGLKSTHWSISWFHLADGPEWTPLFSGGLLILPAQWAEEVRDIMRRYISEADTRRSDSVFPLKHYMELLVFYLKRELSAESSRDLEASRKLQGLWGLVHARLDRKWNLAMLSDECGLSKTSLFRICRRMHGMAPMQMVATMRMERAAELLLGSRQTLACIAGMVGYENEFVLSRAFKRHAGMSPRAFRRAQRRSNENPG